MSDGRGGAPVWLGVVRYFVRGTVAFLPAVVFLRFAQWDGPASDLRWLLAFKVAAPFAAGYLVYAALRRAPSDRLVMATNLYLLMGGLMAWAQVDAGLTWYARLRESAVLVWVLITGAVTTGFTRAGFVGVAGAPAQLVRRASLWLLLAALVALGISWQLRGDPLMAAVLPITALSLLGHRLSKALRQTLNRVGDLG